MDWCNVEELFSSSDFYSNNEIHFSHPDLTKRLKKTLYYAPHKNPSKDTLPFSVTKAAVESFRKAAPTPCGKLGLRYASRVARDACLSPCAMILALIYVERLIHENPDYLQRIQSSELFLITMMVASKYLYDEGSADEVFNDEWAISGLADTHRVNSLEAEFLRAIDWRVFTGKGEFFKSLSVMEARLAYINSCERGWLSYTDMSCILKSASVVEGLQKIIHLLSKVICLSLTLYCGALVVSCGLVALLRHPTSSSLPTSPIEPKSEVNSPLGAIHPERDSSQEGLTPTGDDLELLDAINTTHNQFHPSLPSTPPLISSIFHLPNNTGHKEQIPKLSSHELRQHIDATLFHSPTSLCLNFHPHLNSPSITTGNNHMCHKWSNASYQHNRSSNPNFPHPREYYSQRSERILPPADHQWSSSPHLDPGIDVNYSVNPSSSDPLPDLPSNTFQHHHCTLSTTVVF